MQRATCFWPPKKTRMRARHSSRARTVCDMNELSARAQPSSGRAELGHVLGLKTRLANTRVGADLASRLGGRSRSRIRSRISSAKFLAAFGRATHYELVLTAGRPATSDKQHLSLVVTPRDGNLEPGEFELAVWARRDSLARLAKRSGGGAHSRAFSSSFARRLIWLGIICAATSRSVAEHRGGGGGGHSRACLMLANAMRSPTLILADKPRASHKCHIRAPTLSHGANYKLDWPTRRVAPLGS